MNNNKTVYIPHDIQNESKGGVWIPFEMWNLMKKLDNKWKQKEVKEIWKK